MKNCFHRPEYIFTIDDVDYYASSQTFAKKFDGDAIINFTSTPNIPYILPELETYYDIPYEEIMVLWPDFEKPMVKDKFWYHLHLFIKDKGWEKVCFHCEQGHGRTGTALSCMLVALCGKTAYDAVKMVREFHCIDSVESSEQTEYIMKLDKFYNKRNLRKAKAPMPSMMMVWETLANNKKDTDENTPVSSVKSK